MRKVHSVQRSTYLREGEPSHSAICAGCGNRIQEWMNGFCQVCLRMQSDYKRYGRRNFSPTTGTARPVRVQRSFQDDLDPNKWYHGFTVQLMDAESLVQRLEEQLANIISFHLVFRSFSPMDTLAYIFIFWDNHVGSVTASISAWNNRSSDEGIKQLDQIVDLVHSAVETIYVDNVQEWDDVRRDRVFSKLPGLRRLGWLSYVAEVVQQLED